MAAVQLNASIDDGLKAAVERYCVAHGILMNEFVEEALLDLLEELEDVEDLKRIRHEPTRPFAEVLNDLKLNGSL